VGSIACSGYDCVSASCSPAVCERFHQRGAEFVFGSWDEPSMCPSRRSATNPVVVVAKSGDVRAGNLGVAQRSLAKGYSAAPRARVPAASSGGGRRGQHDRPVRRRHTR